MKYYLVKSLDNSNFKSFISEIMILVSAQTKPLRFNIEANLKQHCYFIQEAAKKGAQLIVFPEMSLTDYERERARELMFTENDSRLDELKQLSKEHSIIIVAGAPVMLQSNLYIGSFVIFPDKPMAIYTKHFLHGSEEDFFQPSFEFDPKFTLQDEYISLAVCADIDHPEHAEEAAKAGSTFYIPSIFFSPGGLPGAYNDLSGYARKYSMNVLMSNFCVEAWGRPSGGGSAFWDNQGNLLAHMNDKDEGLLLVEKDGESWKCSIEKIS